jgi:hypothetical protein
VMGASFILLFILHQICSKLLPRIHAARIKSRNRAAVVRAVRADKSIDKTDHAQVKCSTVDCTVDSSNHENSHSSKGIAFTFPVPSVGVFDVRGHVRYIRAVIRQRLLMSGDVELNPGPLDGMHNH